jgi:Protein of unknown function (DUF1488)
MTSHDPSNLNPDAILLRQIGEELFGPTWQAELSRAICVSDRSMRRWAAGTDEIPEGVWADIHNHAYTRWAPIKYFDDEIVARLNKPERLYPIPNTKPLRAFLGLHFALHTQKGRTIRCLINREVLDDRVPRYPLEATLEYFKGHAETFYAVAERKYNAGEFEHDLITISNADVAGAELPDIRRKIFTDPSQPAVLRYGDVRVDCPTLQEAVLAWQRLSATEKRTATVSARDGGFYTGFEIDMFCASPERAGSAG